jgi:ferric-dicitrate binding protein FerR (iron transport regulator)
MDDRAAKPQSAPRRAWARTGALILFLVTGVLLVASLHSARSEQANGSVAHFEANHQTR